MPGPAEAWDGAATRGSVSWALVLEPCWPFGRPLLHSVGYTVFTTPSLPGFGNGLNNVAGIGCSLSQHASHRLCRVTASCKVLTSHCTIRRERVRGRNSTQPRFGLFPKGAFSMQGLDNALP